MHAVCFDFLPEQADRTKETYYKSFKKFVVDIFEKLTAIPGWKNKIRNTSMLV